MRDERGAWYLLTGLLIGVALGLGYAWGVQPVRYVETSPAALQPEFKGQYRALIALAYTANGDLVRARARLELLQDEDMFRSLAEQAQRTLGQQTSAQEVVADEARALGMLAVALGQEVPGPAIVITLPPPSPTHSPSATTTATITATSTETPLPSATATASETPQPATPPASSTVTPTASLTPTATRTSRYTSTPTKTQIPRPTSTPTLTRTITPTPGGPFLLLSRERVCTQELAAPLIQIEALNAVGEPVPGVLVVVTWSAGNGGISEMRFYTGLKPELGLGYADFTATPGIVYTVQIGENGEAVGDLTAVTCPRSGGGTFWGAWLLKFAQQ